MFERIEVLKGVKYIDRIVKDKYLEELMVDIVEIPSNRKEEEIKKWLIDTNYRLGVNLNTDNRKKNNKNTIYKRYQ